MTKLNLYLISQDVNKDPDTYDAAVVAAPDENTARGIHPIGKDAADKVRALDYWCTVENVKVKLIGEAAKGVEQGVVCSSYNPGYGSSLI